MTSFSPRLISTYYSQHLRNFSLSEVFPQRTTNSYELAYIINDGQCKVSLDGELFPLQGDAIIFRRPGQMNQSFMPYESILLKFTVEGDDSDEFLSKLPSIFQGEQVHRLRQVFEDIYKESISNRAFVPIYQCAKISEILYAIYQDSASYINLHERRVTNSHLLSLLKYIDQSLQHTFTIDQMSQDLAISQRHIYHLFKEELKTTPIKYINECRLNLSKNYLLNSNLPIHTIASLSGYDNVTYYITLFRKKLGITPAKFRKTYNTSADL